MKKEISMLSRPVILNKALQGNAQVLPTWTERATAGTDAELEEFEVVGCLRGKTWHVFAVQRGSLPRRVRQAAKAGLRCVYANGE